MLDFFRLVPKKRTVKIRSVKGVIFHNPSGYKKYFFYVGNFIFLISLTYLIYLYWPLGKSLISYKAINSKPVEKIEIKTPENVQAENKAISEEFTIMIPKIGAKTEVVKNVSPFNKKEYLPVLEMDKVAQAKDTGLPGQKEKAIYLFAHSTTQGLKMVRKNSVFYLLGQLKPDDNVFIIYNNTEYIYKVYAQKVVNAKDVQYLNYGTDGRELLILQTCWPLGTNWKRLLVFAERI